ncbi:NUDIX hydrolase [Kitasatospora sp. LaBMicrA B282]|uniref:NUDIX hydrolase n=1 Tax=Kitasatospora sp. LaBMicrA B282 TaxID=3420949 RepID=UPI003D09A97E
MPSRGRHGTAIAVDLAIFTVQADRLNVLLVRRGTAPFTGRLALPGGFVEDDEDLDTAAARELTEETGLDAATLHVEQLATYGTPGRDPRGRVVTVSYVALVPDLPVPVSGGDACAAAWVPVQQVLPPGPAGTELAFDHGRILADAVERVRGKLEYTALATAFCPPEFTVAQLRHVYEIVWGRPLDPSNFHRKVTRVPGLLVPTGGRTNRDGGRPARLYARGPATTLHPAILRTD